MTLKPLSDRIICEEIKQKERKTSFGLIIPEGDKKKSENLIQVRVLEVGVEVKGIKPGDVLVLNPYQYVSFAEPGREPLIICRELDIDALLVE